MRRYIVYTSLLSLGLGLLAGCGQKGPLVLPPPRATMSTPPAPAHTAATPVPAASVATPAISASRNR